MPTSRPKLPPLVWVTRPAALADDLINGLAQAGFRVHHAPLLCIAPLERGANQAFEAQLARLGTQDAVIFISVNAVESLLALASQTELAALHGLDVYAVGAATAARLAAAGISAFHPAQHMSSEGLLALDRLKNMQGKQVFIVRGCGGRGYLQQQLQARGAVVEHVELYRRNCPAHLSAATQTAVDSGAFTAVLVGSVDTFDNLYQLAPQLKRDTVMLCPSARVSEVVSAKGFSRVAVAASASNADMIETLQHVLAQ